MFRISLVFLFAIAPNERYCLASHPTWMKVEEKVCDVIVDVVMVRCMSLFSYFLLLVNRTTR